MTHDSGATECEDIIAYVDADLEDLVPGFLENRQEDIRTIREALKNNDYETIRILSHSMKGSGGGYGFDQVTNIGEALEQAAKDRNDEEIRKRVDELSNYLEHVQIVYE
ncbi:MAG: Hpt domain-containing protein [Thermodesulfobacteriota bacterium]|nr:Hpt domain-containing protein [Thermodesulfobacteriota bacterium]